MFYLNEFFKSLGESLFRGFSFFSLSCLLAFTLTHRPWVRDIVEKISPEKIVNPYLVAVIDSALEADVVKGRISKLPGVLRLNETTKDENEGKIKSLLTQLGPDYSLGSDLMDFRSIRVSLNPALSKDSLEYIRSEVVRMGGKDHMDVSSIKYPEVAGLMKTHPFYAFLDNAGDWGVIGIIAFLWMITYWLNYNIFRGRGYLVEKFQRKKYVASKAVASGLGLVIVIFVGLGVLNGTLKFFDLVILLMIFSVMWTFLMQEWRWKSTI